MIGDSQGRRAWMAAAVAAMLYILFQVAPLVSAGGGNQNDFKHIYIGSFLVVRDGNPYDAAELFLMAEILADEDSRFERGLLPYVYLPFTGIVLSPLTVLSFPAAVTWWQLINHVLLAGGVVLAACAARWPWSWKSVALLGAAVIWNFSIYRQNSAGQLNTVLFAGSAILVFGLFKRWSVVVLGALTAFLILFKLTPGIFLLYFLATRRWRLAGSTLAWIAGLLAVSLLIAGVKTHLDFLPLLSGMGYGKSTWSEVGQTFWRDAYNQSVNAFLHRILVSWEGSRPWLELGPAVANGLTWIVTLAILGLTGLVWWLLTPRLQAEETALRAECTGVSVAVMAGLLVPSLMWDHYLVQALLPAILLWTHPSVRESRIARGLLVAIVAVFSLGVEFQSLRLHLAMPGQPLQLFPGFLATGAGQAIGRVLFHGAALPRWGFLEGLLGSLKLWPSLALFGLAVWTGLRNRLESDAPLVNSEVSGRS